MSKLKQIDFEILAELMKNARNSDREIARRLGVSQPTITRRRSRLEKELSLTYTAIPDWSKLGFEIIAVTFCLWKHKMFPDERVPEAKDFLQKHPNILFVSTGRGLGADRVCISLHETYRDYYMLMQELRLEWGKYMENLGSFLISIGGDNILRPVTLKYLADYLRSRPESE
jgi:DNA-binding Lrp family transcriptional regulator